MSDFLFQYHKVEPTTWVYLSSLLTIGLYFKFSRLWSVRNLDLIGLILLAPGLLQIEYGVHYARPEIEQLGYVWLFVTNGVFLVRLLLDPMMVRRPLLEPNLSAGGLTFIGIALLLFLMANVMNSPAAPGDPKAHGPGYPPLATVPRLVTQILFPEPQAEPTQHEKDVHRDVIAEATARTMAILSHIAVVLGMIVIGFRHFDNIRTGIAAAMLYLLLPYTAQMTGSVDHVLPAALLIWAVEAYRRPLVAGMLIGLAIGVTCYPVFLLPLWLGFYWQRGLVRFSTGVVLTLAVLVGTLALTAVEFWPQLLNWVGLGDVELTGFWGFITNYQVYRIPVMAAFFCMCAALALWPAQKNLGTLMSCSAAVMLATQFWHPNQGGTYMAWYLPLMLLTIFRPNLEDRIALSVLGEGWFARRRATLNGAERAA